MFHHANAPAQTTIVHCTTESPLIALRIVNLDCFEVGSSIKSTDSIKLTVHNSKTNLNENDCKISLG